MMLDVLLTMHSKLAQGLLPAVAFLLALSFKHWFLDYFLVAIERTPFKASIAASAPARVLTHLCYLQGISTITVIFFLFGPNVQLLWLGVLDALVCLIYYMIRMHNWKRTLFLSSTYVRGIFIAEGVRLALTAVITIVYFASLSQLNFTHDLIYSLTLASDAYLKTKIQVEQITRAIIYASISMLAMSMICSVWYHMRSAHVLSLRWTPLITQVAVVFFILDQAGTKPLLSTALAAICVASTYYYCRVLLARAKSGIREGGILLEASFYLLVATLYVGLITFTYSTTG